jgi:low molecular weight phosphotyrosine protein phosphatase
MAKAVFDNTLTTKGNPLFCHTRSVGTSGYHEGELADARTIQICKEHKVPLQHKAKQITQQDALWADYILAMDSNNMANLKRMLSETAIGKLHLFGEFCTNEAVQEVPDPYWGDLLAFEEVFQQLTIFSECFLTYLKGLHV